MILVLEYVQEHPLRVLTRCVLLSGEPKPDSLIPIRLMLDRGKEGLPNDIRRVLICEAPKRRSTDKEST